MNSVPSRASFEKDNNVQTVTAIGNSWVVCKSKSHAGHVYYFNTLTGEAVWNLSDAEIEKAKKRTNIIQKESGAILESCPEPKDPPNNCQQPCKLHSKPQQSVNHHILNHKFQPFTSLNTHCVNCPGNLVNTAPAPAAYNPNIWAVPPNHQIVISPSNQTPASFSVAYNNLEQHVSVQDPNLPFTRQLDSLPRNRGNRNLRFGRGFNRCNPRNNYMNVSQRSDWCHFNTPSTSYDLRQILSAKHQECKKTNEDSTYSASNSKKQKIQIIKPTPGELHPSDVDDHWLKEHAYVEGTQLKLNIKPIKDIVMLDEKIACWYIVADSNILLEHFNFINVVVSSDENCQLMISDDTMAELQMISRSDNIQYMSHAHHVLRLLSQQFTTGHAVLGKDQSRDSCSNNIIDFTIKLTEQIHNVVLVSNNIEATESNAGIIIFTIEQMKEMIANAKVKNSKPQVFPQKTCINIMKPNDNIRCVGSQSLDITKNNSDVSKIHKKDPAKNRISKNSLKNTAVQTETIFDDTQTTCNIALNLNNIAVLPDDVETNKTIEQTSNVQNTDSENKNTNNTKKKREIRLKRNTFNQSAMSNENNEGKKQFKWRRRKRDCMDVTTENKQLTADFTDSCNNTENEKMNEIIQNNDYDAVNENILCDKINDNSKANDPCEDNFSETTNGSCLIRTGSCDKMLIEETSTSGIISNTTSTVESERFFGIKQSYWKNTCNDSSDQTSNKCVMFEVENSVMEDRLKLRSDEWLSRFVQIMEDILTQVLRLDPPFYHRGLPPPWTLHEATECIKRKFPKDLDITDAASKLTDVLYRHSDKKAGKINSPLEPSAFMEMYSYGVYLVDSLQAAIPDCEDLQTAADALAKLIAEIQNPNEYDNNNDSFIEEIDELTPNVSLCISENNTEKESNSTYGIRQKTHIGGVDQTEKRSDRDKSSTENSPRKYNLRSSQRSSNEKIAEPQTVSFVRNIDIKSTFFSSLNLRKTKNDGDDTCLNKGVENNEETIDNDVRKNKGQDEKGPKIIRQFTKHTQFEERLKNKQRSEYFEPIDDDVDELEEGEVREGDSEDVAGEETDEIEEEQDYRYYGYEYYDYRDDYDDTSEMKGDSNDKNNYASDKDDSCHFEWIIGKIIRELQESFTKIHTFCANVSKEFNSSESLNPLKKEVIQEKAESVKVYLDNLVTSLDRIIFKEDGKGGSTLQSSLQDVGVVMDSTQSVEYRKTIAKGKELACMLLESVNIVLDAVK